MTITCIWRTDEWMVCQWIFHVFFVFWYLQRHPDSSGLTGFISYWNKEPYSPHVVFETPLAYTLNFKLHKPVKVHQFWTWLYFFFLQIFVITFWVKMDWIILVRIKKLGLKKIMIWNCWKLLKKLMRFFWMIKKSIKLKLLLNL